MATRPIGGYTAPVGRYSSWVHIFDTSQSMVVPFEPGKTVRMYVCGITPYDSTHLGHASTYLTYDLLIRRLEDLGHEVELVRNVTDVDDSILPKARELALGYLDVDLTNTAIPASIRGRVGPELATAAASAKAFIGETLARSEPG